MAIISYSDLKSAVADFLNRDDLTAIIPTFISLAEAQINRKLRHWQMVSRATADFNEPFELLPSDWIETIRLGLYGGGPLLQLSSRDMQFQKADPNASGDPRYFAHTAGQIELWPEPTADTGQGELVYYCRLQELGDDNASNWLLAYAPDLYLYGALLQAAPYLKEDDRLAVWGGMFADIMNSMNEESRAASHSGPLKMRLRNG